MLFVVMLLVSAISLAAAAGYFSVSGLSETYAASVISIIIMGTCLEAAKLVLASFIHKFWSKINFVLKSICCLMLAVLMFITSYGVFGHLTSAYQQDSMPLTDITQKLTQDKTELDRLVARKSQMDTQIAKLPDSYVKARGQLIKSFGDEYTKVPTKIDELNKEISDLNSKQLTTQTKIGPIIYMAKVLGQDPDTTIFWFTFLITIVFDPLAVTLVFAYNIALKDRRETLLAAEKVTNDDADNSDELVMPIGHPSPLTLPEVEEDADDENTFPLEEFKVHDVNLETHELAKKWLEQQHVEKEIEPVELDLHESPPPPEPTKSVIDKMYDELRAAKKPVD